MQDPESASHNLHQNAPYLDRCVFSTINDPRPRTLAGRKLWWGTESRVPSQRFLIPLSSETSS